MSGTENNGSFQWLGARIERIKCTVCDYAPETTPELAKLGVFDPDNSANVYWKCPKCGAALHPEIQQVIDTRYLHTTSEGPGGGR